MNIHEEKYVELIEGYKSGPMGVTDEVRCWFELAYRRRFVSGEARQTLEMLVRTRQGFVEGFLTRRGSNTYTGGKG